MAGQLCQSLSSEWRNQKCEQGGGKGPGAGMFRARGRRLEEGSFE